MRITRTYEPSNMFAPETLLKQKKLDPARMTDAKIVEAIRLLAAEARPYSSFEYYLKILGAIRILAEALTLGK